MVVAIKRLSRNSLHGHGEGQVVSGFSGKASTPQSHSVVGILL
uniref:Uncharacterized protein n=1 Tax=Rhizophora mucronata TaxID=61149 RepID=A0A2P2PSN1_RHIMU